MSLNGPSVSDLDQLLICPLCNDVYDVPMMLSCSHTFCRTCILLKFGSNSSMICPDQLCGKSCKNDQVRPDKMKQMLLSLYKRRVEEKKRMLHSEFTCSFCKNKEAMWICFDCNTCATYICNHGCKRVHEISKDLRNHCLVSIDSMKTKKAAELKDLVAESENVIEAYTEKIKELKHLETTARESITMTLKQIDNLENSLTNEIHQICSESRSTVQGNAMSTVNLVQSKQTELTHHLKSVQGCFSNWTSILNEKNTVKLLDENINNEHEFSTNFRIAKDNLQELSKQPINLPHVYVAKSDSTLIKSVLEQMKSMIVVANDANTGRSTLDFAECEGSVPKRSLIKLHDDVRRKETHPHRDHKMNSHIYDATGDANKSLDCNESEECIRKLPTMDDIRYRKAIVSRERLSDGHLNVCSLKPYTTKSANFNINTVQPFRNTRPIRLGYIDDDVWVVFDDGSLEIINNERKENERVFVHRPKRGVQNEIKYRATAVVQFHKQKIVSLKNMHQDAPGLVSICSCGNILETILNGSCIDVSANTEEVFALLETSNTGPGQCIFQCRKGEQGWNIQAIVNTEEMCRIVTTGKYLYISGHADDIIMYDFRNLSTENISVVRKLATAPLKMPEESENSEDMYTANLIDSAGPNELLLCFADPSKNILFIDRGNNSLNVLHHKKAYGVTIPKISGKVYDAEMGASGEIYVLVTDNKRFLLQRITLK